MNAVKFIEERNRMCGTMSEMWGVDAAQIVKNTEEWSAAHPLREYLDTELTPEEIDMDHEAAEQLRQLCRNCDLDRLEKLVKADKDGRLVVLPCKVGTATYYIHYPIVVYPDKSEPEIKRGIFTLCDLDRVGHSVFLTREEAEKALEAMK